MTGSIAPNRPGHHGTVVARTVGTVAISCNVEYLLLKSCTLDVEEHLQCRLYTPAP